MRIEIFGAFGHHVRTLANEQLPPGRYRVTCDGQNRLGEIVSAVVCFCRLLTDGTMLTRKMAVVR